MCPENRGTWGQKAGMQKMIYIKKKNKNKNEKG